MIIYDEQLHYEWTKIENTEKKVNEWFSVQNPNYLLYFYWKNIITYVLIFKFLFFTSEFYLPPTPLPAPKKNENRRP